MAYKLSKLPSGIDRLDVGDVTFFRIADMEQVWWPLDAMFDIDAGELAALLDAAPSESIDRAGRKISLAFNSYLILVDGLKVLVDCGIGNDKVRTNRALWNRRQGDFLDRLARVVSPEDVDIVVNTHLHADHVGWNTVRDGADWRPTFPKGRYVVAAPELDHWRRVYAADPQGALHGAYQDSVQPLLDAGCLETVAVPCAVTPRLTLEPAPGHSPGMAIVRCKTDVGDVVVAADTIHHPLQFGRLALNSRFCEEPDLAAKTRRAFLDRCAVEDTIVAPYHFASPAFGRVRTQTGSDELVFTMLAASTR